MESKGASERVCPSCGLTCCVEGECCYGLGCATTTPWEFVQDDADAERGVARVLDARNRLVCETSPENADLIVCAVNFVAQAGDGVGLPHVKPSTVSPIEAARERQR